MSKQIPLIEGNEAHNKVAIATMAFDRILEDAPTVDIGWARDTAMKMAGIELFTNDYSNFHEQAMKIIIDRGLV
jgi:hypothetical protein